MKEWVSLSSQSVAHIHNFQAQRILTCMVSRLKDVGYGPKILGSVSVTTALFNLVGSVIVGPGFYS